MAFQNASLPPASAATFDAAVEGSVTFNPTTPFDSSMALTILVLLTALFFMGFFSVYIRRFTAAVEDSPSLSAAAASRSAQEQKRGLDSSAVKSLPLAAYGAGEAAKHPMIDDCPICLGDFRDGETVKLIPYCGHVFHPRCLDTWLSSHVTCPMCRSAQLFQSVPEVCMDVKPGKGEIGEGSTVSDEDTCTVARWGSVRRACSCAQLANPTALQITTSL